MNTVTDNRKDYIGGSDIPIIMGLSPFKTRYQLLLEKAQIQESEFKGNRYTEYGNVMEGKIRDYINENRKDKFKPDFIIKDKFRGNCDGLNKKAILEIKTTSQVHNTVDEYKYYLVQLLFYMSLWDRKQGVLAVYERPQDFSEILIPERLQTFNINIEDYKELTNKIFEEVDKFLKDLETIKTKYIFGEEISEQDLIPNDIVSVSQHLIALEQRLVDAKKIEKDIKEFKEKLKWLMEENGVKKWETPNGSKITLVADSEKEVEEIDHKKMIAENEKLAEKYKVFKLKKRKGYVKITLGGK